MSQSLTLQEALQQGGVLDATGLTAADFLEQAQGQGLTALEVSCDRARNRSAVLRAVAKAVDYPEFFGGNLDALYDCLCDTVLDQKAGLALWLDNLHSGDPALEKDAQAILGVCEDVHAWASNNERRFVCVVLHAGKHPDPEPGETPASYSSQDEE